jgi:hypothetical protein
MPSTDRKLELKAKTSVAQTASLAAVYGKGLIFCLSIVAVIRALLHTELEFTVHFSCEVHLTLSVKVLTPSLWAALPTSEHICQHTMELDGALVLKN